MDRIKQVVYGDPEVGSEGIIKNQAKILRSIENIYRLLIAIFVALGGILAIILIFWLQQWL